MSEIQHPTKERRMLELKAMGYTAEQTSTKMKEEGYKHVGVRTVAGYFATVKFDDPTPEFKAELLRRQLLDISLADIEQRLKYRGQIIAGLMPQKIEQEVKTTSLKTMAELFKEDLKASFPDDAEIIAERIKTEKDS